eukprot:147827_1
MALQQRRWKRKNSVKSRPKTQQTKSTFFHAQWAQNQQDSSWVSAKDLRSQRMQQFITFFTKTTYTKQDMSNASDYVDRVLGKLSKTDRSSLFNQRECLTRPTAVSVPNYFHPLCRCIHQIIRSWQYTKNISSQKYLMTQWISVANVLLKYDADVFCCKYCRKKLTKYTQYHKCAQYPSATKSHCTAFQMIFSAFSIARYRKNKYNALLDDQDLQRIDEIHNCLYKLLALILNKYQIEIPLLRLLGARVAKVYMILPVFPSYNMLKSLLCIEGIVPFKRIAKKKVNGKTLYKEKHKFEKYIWVWGNYVPIHWQVALIYAYQQSFAHNMYCSITEVQPDLYPFIPFIVEYIYEPTYDSFIFTNGISYTQVNQCIVYMRQCRGDANRHCTGIKSRRCNTIHGYVHPYAFARNRTNNARVYGGQHIHMLSNRNRHLDTYGDRLSDRSRMCNTTSQSVVHSWVHAFTHPEYKLSRFGFVRDQTANCTEDYLGTFWANLRDLALMANS